MPINVCTPTGSRYPVPTGGTGGQRTAFTITLVPDEDAVAIAECPAIPGCVSQGRTKDEAITNAREAIRECLAARAALGMPIVSAAGR